MSLEQTDSEADDPPGDGWETVGPKLLRDALTDCRFGLEEAFYEAEEAVYSEHGEDFELTPEHIREMRQALNHARRMVEERAAPVAGCDPWGDPRPDIPYGILYEMSNHPRAEDSGGDDE